MAESDQTERERLTGHSRLRQCLVLSCACSCWLVVFASGCWLGLDRPALVGEVGGLELESLLTAVGFLKMDAHHVAARGLGDGQDETREVEVDLVDLGGSLARRVHSSVVVDDGSVVGEVLLVFV